MVADGWATALVVLGYEDAMAVAQEQGLAVYFIRRQGEAFQASHTPAFSRYLENAAPQD
jgi:thiamine biosynthesis lipoprotein